MNNGHREDNSGCCYFHPREKVIGVCAICLSERLLILEAKQGHGHSLIPSSRDHRRAFLQGASTNTNNNNSSSHHRRPSTNLQKIFAFGAFLNRHWKSGGYDVDPCDAASTSSQEDSFISIKFEGNGVTSWDKGNTVSKVPLDQSTNKNSWEVKNHGSYKESKQYLGDEITKDTLSVIEHGKTRSSLRWRRRIGQLFQLGKWKRSNKGSVCHVGAKVEGVKVRKGWMRTLTKRRTKE